MIDRRDFLKLPLAAAIGGALSPTLDARAQAPAAAPKKKSNIRIGRRANPAITDEEMTFLRQIGCDSIAIEGGTEDFVDYDTCAKLKDRLEAQGLAWVGGFNRNVRDSELGFGKPGRDEKIKQFQNYIRMMGRLGVENIMYPWNPGGNTWTNDYEYVRGVKLRAFDIAKHNPREKLQEGNKEYSPEEMWATYEHFMNAILPVCEEANVRMALHADDPPVDMMLGVSRLFTNFKALQRAEEIAKGSRHWTFLMCVGTWGEVGDEKMGKPMLDAIRYFQERNHLCKVHFRNVGAPLPRFFESFTNEGYIDMQAVMDTLVEVGFDGFLNEDHLPSLAGDTPRQYASAANAHGVIQEMHKKALAKHNQAT